VMGRGGSVAAHITTHEGTIAYGLSIPGPNLDFRVYL
jgi:DNA-binding IclR family transcriptional regulator